MRVLGIDCGTERTGWGVIDSDGRRHRILDHGVIRLAVRDPLETRLAMIAVQLRAVILQHAPQAAAVEEVFYAQNVRTALRLAHVRGVALLTIAEAGVAFGEYSPLEVKTSVVGYGRAEKSQVQLMVRSITGMGDAIESEDAADALAVAICHATNIHSPANLRLSGRRTEDERYTAWRRQSCKRRFFKKRSCKDRSGAMRAFLREVLAHPFPHGRGSVSEPRASASGQCGLSLFFTALFVLGAATVAAADAPRLVYTKVFPGSTPAYASITIDRLGAATYKEAADEDEPEKFQIEEAATKQIFDLADKLDHFKRPLESGLKVANMGMKTFHWDDGTAGSEAKFNHTLDESAVAMQDWFERIAECERLVLDLRRAIRHDKLGVNQAVINVQAEWDRKRLVGATQFLPLLDQVAKNETYIHMARERAAQLGDAIRGSDKSKVQ